LLHYLCHFNKLLDLYYLVTAATPVYIIVKNDAYLLTGFMIVFIAGGAIFMMIAPHLLKLVQSDMEKVNATLNVDCFEK
jgi:carbon starvation protein CstA